MSEPEGQPRPEGSGSLFLGRYRLRSLLGSGASADVWLAQDERLGRPVAIKLLHPHLLPDAASRERFAAEARAVARVAHPGIVGVYDVVIDGRTAAIVFEYVQGETLEARLRRAGRLPVTDAAEIAAQLAEALAAAHAAGLVHRDVKPGNILLDTSGRPRLVDFGIAQALGDAQARMTRQGEIVGTLRSLAPEQLAGWPGTPAADLYALGTVLYEMVAGRPPYDATTPVGLVEQQRLPPAPVPDLPPGLAALVLRCLQPDPSLRPASAIEVASYLRGWLAAASPAPTPGAVRLPVTPRLPPLPANSAATTMGPGRAAGPTRIDRPKPHRSFGWRLVATGLVLLPVVAALLAGWPLILAAAAPTHGAPGVAERGTPTPSPARATARITPRPTPTPTPTPVPTPTPTPTPPPLPSALSIVSPTDGVSVDSRTIEVAGLAPPGSTVTRDIPLWPDDHVKTGKDGRWQMRVDLEFGQNVLTFRLGDDRSTDVHVTVYYNP